MIIKTFAQCYSMLIQKELSIFRDCFRKIIKFTQAKQTIPFSMLLVFSTGCKIFSQQSTKGSTSLQVLKRCISAPTPSLVFFLRLLSRASHQTFFRNKITYCIQSEINGIRNWQKLSHKPHYFFN